MTQKAGVDDRRTACGELVAMCRNRRNALWAGRPQLRDWNEATLLRQQEVKAAREELQTKAGMSIAGTIWQTLRVSCKMKLHKAVAMKITETRRDRWFVRRKQILLSGSAR